MEKRIELEVRGRKPEEVHELNLDNCRSSNITGLTDVFVNLEYLSMINVGLQNLKGFPSLPKLRQLDLSDNRLTGGLESLTNAPNLTHLNLSGNKIDDMAALEPLLANLKSLDMFNCGVTSSETYREKMFEFLPQMKYLDGFDKEDNECSTEGSENGEGVEDDDSEDEEGDEEDHSDLAYSQSSNAAQDEDETEDFEPGVEADEDDDVDDDEDEEDDEYVDEEQEKSSGAAKGTKRKREDGVSN